MAFAFCILYSTDSYGQVKTGKDSAKANQIKDTLKTTIPGDSLKPQDTLKRSNGSDTFRISRDALDAIIDYHSDDSIYFDLKSMKATLFGNAEVKYESMDLKSDFIVVDFNKRELYARGRIDDSTGKYVGRPNFNDGEHETDADTMIYNFNTKRGRTYGIIMKEGESYIHCNKVLRDDDKNIYSDRGKYTTCNREDHPHFYIDARKVKIIPNNKIIFGPSNLMIEDVPTPLYLPFGFFPLNNGQKSGIIAPEYGLSGNFGPYLKNGGYYFGINEHFDEALTGDFYFRGSWRLASLTRYANRYKYSGNFGIEFSKYLYSEPEDPDYKTNNVRSFGIRWMHSMDPKSKPGRTFSANVNIQKDFSAKLNSNNATQIVSNQFNSSVSFAKSLFENKANYSINLTHSQNTQTHAFSMTLPSINFSVQRITPFSKPDKFGKYKIYKDLGVSYNLSADNRVDTKDSVFFSGQPLVYLFPNFSDFVFNAKPSGTLPVPDQFKSGIVHTLPFTLGSYKFIKQHFSMTPTFGYQEYWYFKTVEKKWDDVNDTLLTFYNDGFARGYQYNAAVNVGTQVFGTFPMKFKKLSALRHTISPNFGFSYQPDFSQEKYGVWKEVQVDTHGRMEKYSTFQEGIKGGPGSGAQGLFNYSIGNNLQAKVLKKTDSSSKFENVSWLENLSIAGNYNFLKETMKLSDISFAGFTTLYKILRVNGNANLRPYAKQGMTYINKFELTENGRLGSWTAASVQFATSFDPELLKSLRGKGDTTGKVRSEQEKKEMEKVRDRPDQYVRFDIPWSINLNYSVNYTREYYEKQVLRTFSFGGDVSVTPKWKVGIMSGYDFEQKKISYTQIGVNRNLHCWSLSFQWIPDGIRQSFQFSIFANSSTLQSLRVTKKRLWMDQ